MTPLPKLADAAKDAGVVEPKDYAIFQNHGYAGLYGGLFAQDIHVRKGLKKGQQILDHSVKKLEAKTRKTLSKGKRA